MTCIENNDPTLAILMFVNFGRNTPGASHYKTAVFGMTGHVCRGMWTILIGCAALSMTWRVTDTGRLLWIR